MVLRVVSHVGIWMAPISRKVGGEKVGWWARDGGRPEDGLGGLMLVVLLLIRHHVL